MSGLFFLVFNESIKALIYGLGRVLCIPLLEGGKKNNSKRKFGRIKRTNGFLKLPGSRTCQQHLNRQSFSSAQAHSF